jgi:hypothetical protein
MVCAARARRLRDRRWCRSRAMRPSAPWRGEVMRGVAPVAAVAGQPGMAREGPPGRLLEHDGVVAVPGPGLAGGDDAPVAGPADDLRVDAALVILALGGAVLVADGDEGAAGGPAVPDGPSAAAWAGRRGAVRVGRQPGAPRSRRCRTALPAAPSLGSCGGPGRAAAPGPGIRAPGGARGRRRGRRPTAARSACGAARRSGRPRRAGQLSCGGRAVDAWAESAFLIHTLAVRACVR